MLSRDRRIGFRVPTEIFLNQVVGDRVFRALTSNLSDSGVYLNHVPGAPIPDRGVVGLEFCLPGSDEVIWARGEVCYRKDDPYFRGAGIKITAMPVTYARMLRDYCIEARRTRLSALLARIRA